METKKVKKSEDYIAVLNATKNEIVKIETEICQECKINPKIPFKNICILCEKNYDTTKLCYQCKYCVLNREYLKSTSNYFTLIQYEKTSLGDFLEIWQCSLCKHYLQMQLMLPGTLRDIIHKQFRTYHLKYHCDKLKKGEIKIS